MNYLAHAYLSFGKPDILAGNMISDFVKGKQKFKYSEGVQNGIVLHRMIDTFTDSHEATHAAKQYFKEAVGLYAGAFADVVYDHFLALDETQHTPQQLEEFTIKTYRTLDDYVAIFPARFAQMFPYMKTQNWLYNYRTVDGINKSFGGVVQRAAYLNSSEAVFDAFLNHYNELKVCYEVFFFDVKKYAEEQLNLLLSSS
ncbi:MAG: ACP phosphodiesterase [Bacteroidota bacterium]|nr:ACP phosphodiesterase [Bacteroidota bacterium]